MVAHQADVFPVALVRLAFSCHAPYVCVAVGYVRTKCGQCLDRLHMSSGVAVCLHVVFQCMLISTWSVFLISDCCLLHGLLHGRWSLLFDLNHPHQIGSDL